MTESLSRCSIVLAMATMAAIAGCGLVDGQSQDRRREVHSAFIADPDAATHRYRPIWEQGRGRARTPDEQVELLTAAEYLQIHDPVNRAEYVGFVLANADSTDEVVQGSAFSAMAKSSDERTLHALIDHLAVPRVRLSRAVATAIEYRRLTAEADGRTHEVRQIEAAYASACGKAGPRLAPLDELCKAQGFD